MRGILLRILRLAGLGVFAIASIFYFSNTALAHRNGCHAWHSCPSDSGSYVCGDTGHYNYCPSQVTTRPIAPNPKPPAPTPPPPPAPKLPIISTRSESNLEPIKFQNKEEFTDSEYDDFSKNLTIGYDGVLKKTTQIVLNDRVESGREVIATDIIKPAQNQVTLHGSRKRPTAVISEVKSSAKGWFASAKNKYDVAGKYQANAEVVLMIDNKKLNRVKTDKNGNFTFKGALIKANTAQLKILSSEPRGWFGRKEQTISEPTDIDVTKKFISTEYQKIHLNQR